jgi:hypothetical protein
MARKSAAVRPVAAAAGAPTGMAINGPMRRLESATPTAVKSFSPLVISQTINTIERRIMPPSQPPRMVKPSGKAMKRKTASLVMPHPARRVQPRCEVTV